MTHPCLKILLGLGALAGTTLASAASVQPHIPADTVFYDGMTDDFDKTRLAEAYAPASSLMDFATEATDPATAADEGGPGAGILAALYADYSASWGEDKHPLARFGMAADGEYALYTVGAVPVVRLTADEPAQLRDRLAAARDAAGVKAAKGKIAGVEVQRYPFSLEQADANLDLVVAIHDGQGILTVAGSAVPEDALRVALGEDQPARSLADTNRPAKLADRHDLTAGAVGYLDQAAIVAGLADPEANRFGGMVEPLLKAWGASEDVPLQALREPACRKEATAMAQSAPYTVSGFTEINPKAERVQMRNLVRLTDSDVGKQLNRLRGHIPSATDQRALMEIGLGLHVQEFVPALQALAKGFTQSQYECKGLKTAQQAVQGQSIGQLGMFSATLGDTRGFKAALLSLGKNQEGSENEDASSASKEGDSIPGMSGVVEIATTEPQALWQLASSMMSLPADAKKPQAGGEPVAVDHGMGPDLELKAAIRQNAMVVLVGDTPLPKAAGEKNLDANGVLSLREDLGRLARSAKGSVDQLGANEQANNALAKAQALNAYLDMGLDITADGVALDLEMGPTQ